MEQFVNSRTKALCCACPEFVRFYRHIHYRTLLYHQWMLGDSLSTLHFQGDPSGRTLAPGLFSADSKPSKCGLREAGPSVRRVCFPSRESRPHIDFTSAQTFLHTHLPLCSGPTIAAPCPRHMETQYTLCAIPEPQVAL